MYSYKDAQINYNEYMMNYLSTTDYYNHKFFHCRSPNHSDNKPSMKYNPKKNNVHCFSCGVTYGLIDLVMIDHKLNYAEAINYIKVNLLNEKPIQLNITHQINDFTQFYLKLDINNDYLRKRGINDYLAYKFGVRYNRYNNSVIITNGVNNYTERFIDEKDGVRYKHYGSVELYNKTQPVNCDKPTIIVEGEIDCLSIYEAIGFKEGVKIKELPCNCIALGSANNWYKLVDADIDNIIIALDNDDAGRKATTELSRELIKRGKISKIANLYGNYKDANECLINNRELLENNIKEVII